MTNYVLNEEKMFADITDGVAIVINSETGIYYGYNELGTAVLDNLIKGVSVEKILEALKFLPNAPTNIEELFDNFIKENLEKEILIKGNGANANAEIDSKLAFDSFEMSFNEYDDAQEMLLADPIHEVKEETGWTPEKDSVGYTKEETREREKKMEK